MQHKNIALYAFLAFSLSTFWMVEAGKELALFQEDHHQKQRSLTLSHMQQSGEQTYSPPLPQPPILQFRSLKLPLKQDFYSYGTKNTIQRLSGICNIPPLEAMPLDSLKHLHPDRLHQIPKDRARQIARTSLTLWSLEQWIAIVNAADFQQIPAIQRPIDQNSPQRSLQDERQRRRLKHSLSQQRKPFRPILPHSILRIPNQNHIEKLPFIRQKQGGGFFPRCPFYGGAGFKK